jgi:uncharacterized membrane-anchored protein
MLTLEEAVKRSKELGQKALTIPSHLTGLINMTHEQIKLLAKTYSENEADNKHAENLLLLAKNFGTSEDVVYLEKAIHDLELSGRVGMPRLDANISTRLWDAAPKEFIDAWCENDTDE